MSDLRKLIDRCNLGTEIRKGRGKHQLLRDLSRLKRVSVEQIVEGLSLGALQSACRELGLDDTGRELHLTQQILARFGRSARRPAAPATSRPAGTG